MTKVNQLYRKILSMILGGMFLVSCSGLAAQTTPTPDLAVEEDTPVMVSATGKVVPAQWSRLSLSASGIVEEVVKEGEHVEADQVLVRLRGKEDLQAAIAAAEFELSSAQKAHDDLKTNAEDTRTAALERISAATKAVRDAQYQMDNFTVPQPQSRLSTSEALLLMEQKLDEARAAFEPYKYYPSTDDRREDLKEDLDEAQADYNSAVKRLQYETELEVAKNRLNTAVQDFETWKDGPDPGEVAVAEARLANARAALAAAEARLDDLELRAPFGGTISDVDLRAGEWVTAGQPILLIADLDNLQIETTDLNEIDAARVQMGDTVQVTFDALPGKNIRGIVKSIAPKSSEGTGVNYTVVILMDEVPVELRWGMTAFTDIQVE